MLHATYHVTRMYTHLHLITDGTVQLHCEIEASHINYQTDHGNNLQASVT